MDAHFLNLLIYAHAFTLIYQEIWVKDVKGSGICDALTIPPRITADKLTKKNNMSGSLNRREYGYDGI